jgi:hypothetical protein
MKKGNIETVKTKRGSIYIGDKSKHIISKSEKKVKLNNSKI